MTLSLPCDKHLPGVSISLPWLIFGGVDNDLAGDVALGVAGLILARDLPVLWQYDLPAMLRVETGLSGDELLDTVDGGMVGVLDLFGSV